MRRPSTLRPPLSAVVMQHLEGAAHLRHVRSLFVRAPHVGLWHLERLDERIAAHLDGVAVDSTAGVGLSGQLLDMRAAGDVFITTVCAIQDRDWKRIHALLQPPGGQPACRAGLLSAFGWVSAAHLEGITKRLLESAAPFHRQVGLAACAMHGVDPGAVLGKALHDADTGLRAHSARVASRVGRLDLLDACLAALADDHPSCAFEAARSALLLGDRTASIDSLERLAVDPASGDETRLSALRLLLKVVSPARARTLLARLAKDGSKVRPLIHAVAVNGDPHYVPWLIGQMAQPEVSRLAGEAFSFITGVDIAHHRLDLRTSPGLDLGPNDDSADSNVAMDEDDNLPWPDTAKVDAWWRAQGVRFVAGTRYFLGDVPTVEDCLQVLRTGFQRQRIAAAEYRTLLAPGTPLFNTAAPAWRQRRLLSS
jgi:uncharacterized protein (TIGR02270 family)